MQYSSYHERMTKKNLSLEGIRTHDLPMLVARLLRNIYLNSSHDYYITTFSIQFHVLYLYFRKTNFIKKLFPLHYIQRSRQYFRMENTKYYLFFPFFLRSDNHNLDNLFHVLFILQFKKQCLSVFPQAGKQS